MALVIRDMSSSLDVYVTGPNDSRQNPFGDGAGMLHDWMSCAATDDDRAILQAALDSLGAIVMGRRSFDKNEGDGGWGDTGPVGETPCFVVTHSIPTAAHPPVFTFVTDGVVSAIEQAKHAAGDKVVGLHRATIHAAGTPAGPGRRDTRARDPGAARWRYLAVRHARRIDHPRTHPSASHPGGDADRVPRRPESHSAAPPRHTL
jgi:dihydrofolate reductase